MRRGQVNRVQSTLTKGTPASRTSKAPRIYCENCPEALKNPGCTTEQSTEHTIHTPCLENSPCRGLVSGAFRLYGGSSSTPRTYSPHVRGHAFWTLFHASIDARALPCNPRMISCTDSVGGGMKGFTKKVPPDGFRLQAPPVLPAGCGPAGVGDTGTINRLEMEGTQGQNKRGAALSPCLCRRQGGEAGNRLLTVEC
jgi:hypothetical protein